MNNNSTTNSEKKPIINNYEALRLIDLIQQGDSNAEKELAELGSVFVKAVAKLAGGNGGGRPDSATAGARDSAALEKALESAAEIASGLVK